MVKWFFHWLLKTKGIGFELKFSVVNVTKGGNSARAKTKVNQIVDTSSGGEMIGFITGVECIKSLLYNK